VGSPSLDSAALPLPAEPMSRPLLIAALLSLLATPALAQKPPYEGYLCCNLFNDGSWINDINYRSERHKLIPAGTPVKVLGFGRWRIQVEIDGKKTDIGNDFSRTVPLEEWARRIVVPEDPTRALAGAPRKVQEAVRNARLLPGMTRAQVLLAVGWPPLSYNADLEAPLWKYWATRSYEYQIFWDDKGRVDRIFGTPEARALVAAE
jgi:hypothetical protein